jgi:hypothetical protein
MTDHKPALAALVAQVLDRRYPKQPFEGSEKEDWLRSAMEGDPIVLLEAAWEWREQHREGGFRPYPGQLRREICDGWVRDRTPYLSLDRAITRVKTNEPIEGLDLLIARMGKAYFDEALQGPVTVTHRQLWEQACYEHRVYAFAKKRMEYRGTPPWNPGESKGLGLPNGASFRAALGTPATREESPMLSLGSTLAQSKRLGGAPEAKP